MEREIIEHLGINFFDNTYLHYEETKPYHNRHEGVNDALINLPDRFVNLELADKMNELEFPQNSLFYHTHSKFGLLNRMSIDFTGNASSAYDLFELMQFITVGSKLNECFNGRFSAKGLHALNANSLAEFLIEYYIKHPGYFDF